MEGDARLSQGPHVSVSTGASCWWAPGMPCSSLGPTCALSCPHCQKCLPLPALLAGFPASLFLPRSQDLPQIHGISPHPLGLGAFLPELPNAWACLQHRALGHCHWSLRRQVLREHLCPAHSAQDRNTC